MEESPKTLRDEFAMAALTGWLADGSVSNEETAAVRAYEFADAMMAARAQSRKASAPLPDQKEKGL